ncbi:MAG TPA: hypothetical protein VJ696_11530 [Rhodanobacteraceae bacterium]|nr:hypothetical protein [Rhodanobacteraceae bacterium]
MSDPAPSPWTDERDYAAHLEDERRLFAWTLRRYGSWPEADALAASRLFYPYEAPGDYRGLLFHAEAWHWAMLRLHGEQYWIAHPELEAPSQEYRDAAAG